MSQSLHGLRILNTRPEEQAQALSQEITDAGGISVECPTLEIKATSTEWISKLPDLNRVDRAIFISANSVHHCFSNLLKENINWPTQIQIIAIGQASARTLQAYNIRVDEIPDFPDSEHLLTLQTLQQLNNQIVLLFKGEEGRVLIEKNLIERGAKLITLNVYKRDIPKISHQFIDSIWRNDLVDIILFTSEQSMHNLFKLFGEEARSWLQNKPCVVISKRLANAAALLGINKITVSHPNRMLNALFDSKYINKD